MHILIGVLLLIIVAIAAFVLGMIYKEKVLAEAAGERQALKSEVAQKISKI